MNYVETMKKLIDNGLKEFTHRDILQITNTNCPYTVLKYLQKYYEIDYEIVEKNKIVLENNEEKIKKIRFRKFIVKGEKECQKI